MSLDTVLAILEERGLSIAVDAAGKPRIKGKKKEITDAVLETLAAYREEIVARLNPPPRREFLWPGNGSISPDYLNMPETWFPVGAWYWRWEGESDSQWKLIPGMREIGNEHEPK